MASPDEPNGHFRVSRRIDATAIIAGIVLLAGATGAIVTGYWGVSAEQMKLDAKFELIDLRLKNDEAMAIDKRAEEAAFKAEIRAGLAQLIQANADLRTQLATQDNAKRR